MLVLGVFKDAEQVYNIAEGLRGTSESAQNRYLGFFEDDMYEYDKAEGIRGTWCPGWTSSLGVSC